MCEIKKSKHQIQFFCRSHSRLISQWLSIISQCILQFVSYLFIVDILHVSLSSAVHIYLFVLIKSILHYPYLSLPVPNSHIQLNICCLSFYLKAFSHINIPLMLFPIGQWISLHLNDFILKWNMPRFRLCSSCPWLTWHSWASLPCRSSIEGKTKLLIRKHGYILKINFKSGNIRPRQRLCFATPRNDYIFAPVLIETKI